MTVNQHNGLLCCLGNSCEKMAVARCSTGCNGDFSKTTQLGYVLLNKQWTVNCFSTAVVYSSCVAYNARVRRCNKSDTSSNMSCGTMLGKNMTLQKEQKTREDPRVTRTRNLIRDALDRMLQEKPFSDISVQDIAEQATINRATFYAHFEDKYGLLENLVRTNYRHNLSENVPGAAADVASMLSAVALTTLEDVRAHKKAKVDKEFEPQLERAMQDELFSFLLPAFGDAAALVVSSAVIGTTLRWRVDRYKQPPQEIVQSLVGVLTRGVRLQHGNV